MNLANLNELQIRAIERLTVGQRTNGLWSSLRRSFLTASNFGRALQAQRCNQLTKFHEEFKQPPNLCEIAAIKWGIDHEKDGLEEYIRQTGFCVRESGLWIFKNCLLAASPDGLVMDGEDVQGIVEIKCPWKLRDKLIHSERDIIAMLPYLAYPKSLRPFTNYYHQIQGQLMATGADWCDLFVWCPTGSLKIRIYPNPSWLRTSLPMLLNIAHFLIPNPESNILNIKQLALKMEKEPQSDSK